MNKHQLLLNAALAGLISASLASAETKTTSKAASKSAAPQKAEKVECFGVNACAGKTECGVPGKNSCHGKNGCKGKGMMKMTKEECAAKGGSTTPPAAE